MNIFFSSSKLGKTPFLHTDILIVRLIYTQKVINLKNVHRQALFHVDDLTTVQVLGSLSILSVVVCKTLIVNANKVLNSSTDKYFNKTYLLPKTLHKLQGLKSLKETFVLTKRKSLKVSISTILKLNNNYSLRKYSSVSFKLRNGIYIQKTCFYLTILKVLVSH